MRFSDELTGARHTRESARVLVIALSAVPFTLLTIPLPRGMPIKWGWVIVAVVIVVLDMAKLAYDGMFKDQLRRPIPAWELMIELSIFTVAAGLAIYAGSGEIGIYRQLLVILIVYWAMWGDAGMFLFGTLTAIVTLGAATLAQGVAPAIVATLIVEYGLCWGATGLVVFLLVARINRAKQRSQRLTATARALAQLAAVAARSNDLGSALHTSVPLVSAVVPSVRVWAVSVGPEGESVDVIAEWSDARRAAAENRPLDPAELHALRSGPPLLAADRSLLPIGEVDGRLLTFVLDGCEDIERDAAEGTVGSVVTVLTNMIERVVFVRALEESARTDPLTGLANRRALTERLDHDIEVARRTDAPLCVVMIDLDHFKVFNDTFGHVAGDAVLHDVARTFAGRARSSDTVARYGGEEFCICLPDTAVTSAVRLITDQRRLILDVRTDAPVTFSAGIAQWDGVESRESLVARADAALYRAKVEGRDRVEAAEAVAGPSSRL